MPVRVFDFFCGCGGTSAGFRAAGMQVALGIDNDEDARRTFTSNFPEAAFLSDDIRNIAIQDVNAYIGERADPVLFSGCAPCQPFTKQNTVRNEHDQRVPLLAEFGRFVEFCHPELIFIENVPGIQRVPTEGSPIIQFNILLNRLGYYSTFGVVNARDYGVPQHRKRFVLIASLYGEIALPHRTHGTGTLNENYSTVWEAIGDLPPLAAGQEHPEVLNHRAARLSETNLQRIAFSPPGGGRQDWPEELQLDCHNTERNGRPAYRGHTDVYGRMRPDAPSTALTTRCVSLSNGRFGHPYQDRAMSVREAACLQSFPRDFIFSGSLNSMARQIGNAVPVLMAQRFGESFLAHLAENNIEIGE